MGIEKLKREVTQIREDFDRFRVDFSSIREEYQAYSRVEDIDTFLSIARSCFPNYNCGVASVYLKKALGKGRIVNGRYGAQCKQMHTFLLIGRNVVDITADQFGGPRVYVGPLVKPWTLN